MFKLTIVLVALMFVGLSLGASTQKGQQGYTILEVSTMSKNINE